MLVVAALASIHTSYTSDFCQDQDVSSSRGLCNDSLPVFLAEAALMLNALSKLPAALRKSRHICSPRKKDKVAEQGVTDAGACKSSSSALVKGC